MTLKIVRILYKEGFIQSVFDSTVKDGARIINLPKFYVHYIGALLWRYEESITNIDPLTFPTISQKNYSLFIIKFKQEKAQFFWAFFIYYL